ncbi:MAG TPA: type IV pilus assembly protein PilM [Planctomycetaceae bacterium]|nr:type IV pilus assembly protein PilM [Planctomycetaceae bacterium]
MAENRGVWGIDIGQAGLKAIRLRYADAASQVIAVAFDYVPHPKILSQPDAIPEELIPQALETFLSRNDVSGDALAISVPGQTALARFIQLPPVEAGKVADIVKYEARQQIPFALEDVIWDYQTLGGGAEESGFMLEAEVGLFAMKREQVLQQLKPFTDKKLEVELIQIAPLALFNVLSYDQLGIRPSKSGEDSSEASDEHVIMLDMGADNTTLLVSNGRKIWIRNVPLGGNHFTRALTKEMKLTFAKAEHLKCNATKSPDPRAVFQALRPVFNDYVAEIQRSIGYFSSVNRNAKIKKVVGVGNGFKLAGLQKFLQQNLQYDVERLDGFKAVVGDTVLNAPLFQENILAFAVPYGLALQGLELTRIKTTLLPPEIKTARIIRRKKPWAVTAAAVLLLLLTISGVLNARVQQSVSEERWGDNDGAIKQVKDFNSLLASKNSAYTKTKSDNGTIKGNQTKLLMPLETRYNWLEIYRTISDVLPRDTDEQRNETDVEKRHRITVTLISQKKEADLKTSWYDKLPPLGLSRMLPGDKAAAPEGAGYVFTLECVHFHNDPTDPYGVGVNYAIAKMLREGLHLWEKGGTPVRAIGISHATIPFAHEDPNFEYDPNFRYSRGQALPGLGGGGGGFGGGYGGDDQGGDYDPDAGVPLTDDSMGYDDQMEGGYDPDGGSGQAGGYGQPGATAGLGLPFDPTKLLKEDNTKPSQTKFITRTRFTVQFVWKPMSSLERAKFAVLNDLFAKASTGGASAADAPAAPGAGLPSLQEANEHLKNLNELNIAERHKERLLRDKLEITQQEYDLFVKRYTADRQPATPPGG